MSAETTVEAPASPLPARARHDTAFLHRGAIAAGRGTAAWAVMILVAIVSFLLEVRPLADVGERFIGHADQAQVATVARNIAQGRGANADCVWILREGGRPGNAVRQPEGYWSIYMATLLAVSFKLLGPTRVAVLATASLVKIAIAFTGFHWCYRLSHDRWAATVCGVFLLVDPSMTNCIAGLSDIYLTACVLAAVLAMVKAWEKRSGSWALACGVATGLAIGMKPSGLILLVAAPLGLALALGLRGALKHVALVLLGAGLGALPLMLHNLHAGGTLLWPDLRLIHSAASVAATGGTWEASIYDPAAPAAPPSWTGDGLTSRAWFLFDYIVQAMRGSTVPVYLALLAFYALGLHLRKWRDDRFTLRSAAAVLADLTLILILGALCLATTVPFQSRYFNFLVPPMAILGIAAAARRSRGIVVVVGLYALASGAHACYEWWDSTVSTTRVATYQQAAALLPEGAVVMNSDPWEFAFHTRRLSVMVPYTNDDAAIRNLARRYGVAYLAIVENDLRHPEFSARLAQRPPDYLEPVYRSEQLVILKFKGF